MSHDFYMARFQFHEAYSAQVIGTSTKAHSKVHMKPLGRHSWSVWRVAPIHVYLSVWRGAGGLQAQKTQRSSDWGTESTRNPSRPGSSSVIEKQGLLFQTLSHRQGSAFFHLSKWFYKVLGCSDWTWVRNFEVWGLSDTFCCALKQVSEKSIVFLLEASVSFLTQLIMCDYKHISIKYHKKEI